MWQYVVEVRWASQEAFSGRIVLETGLDDCACVCRGGYFIDPMGLSTDSCPVVYLGEETCSQVEDIPCNGQSVVVYERNPLNPCEAPGTGVAMMEFFADAPPVEITDKDPALTVIIEVGKMLCYGTWRGWVPSCHCSGPTTIDQLTWGRVKAVYR
jgi:hypothetical protein